jgi:hypothetical protein
VLAAPALPVAVKVAEVEVPWIVAVAEFAPAAVPKVRVEEERPLEFVKLLVLESDPPPVTTAQSIVAPFTTFPFASFTIATKAEASAEPAVPVWPLPVDTAIVEAEPALPVALKVTL